MQKGTLSGILTVSILTFVAACIWIGNIETRAEALKAEVEARTSTMAMVGTGIKALFDGFTFGAFEQEGPFAESKKAERWQNEVYSRVRGLEGEYSIARFLKIGSVLVAIGCGIGLFVMCQGGRKGEVAARNRP